MAPGRSMSVVPEPAPSLTGMQAPGSAVGASFVKRPERDTRDLTMGKMETEQGVDYRPNLSSPSVLRTDERIQKCRNASGMLFHAVVLGASAVSNFGLRDPCQLADEPSRLGVWLVVVYALGVAVLAFSGIAILFSQKHIRLCSPALVTVMHAVLGIIVPQWRASAGCTVPTASWESGVLQTCALQAVAIIVHPSGWDTWFVACSLLLVSLVVAATQATQLCPRGMGQTFFFPAVFLLSCVGALGHPSLVQHWCFQDLCLLVKEFLVGRSTEEDSIQSALAPLLDPAWKTSRGLHERLCYAALALKDAMASRWLQRLLVELMKNMYDEVASLKVTVNADELGLEQAPRDVQDFVLENMLQSPPPAADGQPDSPHWNSSERSVCAPSAGTSFNEQLKSFVGSLGWVEEPLPVARPMSEEASDMLEFGLGRWNLDLPRFSSLTGNQPLHALGIAAFQPYVQDLQLSMRAARAFLSALEARYHNTIPYHTSTHAADVLNSMLYFLRIRSSQLTGLDALHGLAGVTAAAAHDVGHDGFSNRFHATVQTPLAQLYNDQSCLENMHCAITFTLLSVEGTNFLASQPPSSRSVFRSVVVHMILDTDLAKHLQSVKDFRKDFIEDRGEKLDESKLKARLLSFVLKASDIGGSAKPFALHATWATRINAEFYQQGDKEIELGLPPSPMCDRSTGNIVQSQGGFFDFIVMPLFTALHEHVKSKRFKMEVQAEIERNKAFWAGLVDPAFNYEDPESNVPKLCRLYQEKKEQMQAEEHIGLGAPISRSGRARGSEVGQAVAVISQGLNSFFGRGSTVDIGGAAAQRGAASLGFSAFRTATRVSPVTPLRRIGEDS